MSINPAPLLTLRNLSKKYFLARKSLWAIKNIDLELFPGEILGIVGESGSGKTTLAHTILQLQKPSSGKIYFQNIDLTTLSKKEMKPIRRRLQMVFQNPYASLNPRMTVEEILKEPLDIHRLSHHQKRITEILQLVGLSEDHKTRFPHEFSGGQRQRIGIARALILEPELIVCDEPISALDVSIQAQIINLIKTLQQRMQLTYIFIAHNLSMVKYLCNRVIVMYLGHIVEQAPSDLLYKNPLHPYTQALLSSVPIPDPQIEKKRKSITLPGETLPFSSSGCPFYNRCPRATSICLQHTPKIKEVSPHHFVSCHHISSDCGLKNN